MLLGVEFGLIARLLKIVPYVVGPPVIDNCYYSDAITPSV